jgi:cyclopropane-fatty-acyl-phospholipid synthase
MKAYRSLVLRLLQRFTEGSLEMVFPEGTSRVFGNPQGPIGAVIHIKEEAFFRRVILHGEIGFGEAFVDGDWDTPDIAAVVRWMLANTQHLPGMAASGKRSVFWNLLAFANRVRHWANRNTRTNARCNIAAHYDLSNDFYGLWLDGGMAYSSALFNHPHQDLHAAQQNKFRRLAEKMGIRPGQQVLEIGCGWGGMALFLAQEYGAHVTAVTLSEAQLEKTRQRVAELGLQQRIEVRLQDYRDLSGQFDHIVSIEMLEAVGHRFLKTFFDRCHRLLKNTGSLGIQVILSPDSRYKGDRKTPDWIQKHVFPGGHLPSLAAIQQSINATGDLDLLHLESFGLHYAETLRRWRTRFNEEFTKARKLGFDETFRRKWNYYLSYCEAAFDMRNINVAQLVYSRPNNTRFALPHERPTVCPVLSVAS